MFWKYINNIQSYKKKIYSLFIYSRKTDDKKDVHFGMKAFNLPQLFILFMRSSSGNLHFNSNNSLC